MATSYPYKTTIYWNVFPVELTDQAALDAFYDQELLPQITAWVAAGKTNGSVEGIFNSPVEGGRTFYRYWDTEASAQAYIDFAINDYINSGYSAPTGTSIVNVG